MTMKIKKRVNPNLYVAAMQSGGSFPVFRARRRMRGAGLGSAFKHIARGVLKMGKKILPKVGKSLGKKLMPIAIEAGSDVLRGKNVKQTMKRAAKQGKETLASSTRAALQKELAKFTGGRRQRGGHLMKRRKNKLKGR